MSQEITRVVDAEAVVAAFIRAMNTWEENAWRSMRAASETWTPESYWPGIVASLKLVFDEFCTDRERPNGRLGSYQHPPEYNPATEHVRDSQSLGRKARVDTERRAILGGGTLRYTLVRRGDRWLIDNVKRRNGDGWHREIL